MLQPKPADRPTSKDTFRYEWMKASSSDSDLPTIQHSLSEVHVAQDYLAVDNSLDAQPFQSAERRTRSYQYQDTASQRAQSTPSFMETVRRQPREESNPRLPSRKAEPAAHDIVTKDNLLALPARLMSLSKATSRPVFDGAADMSSSDLKRGMVTDLPETAAAENIASPDKVSRSDGGATEALPPGWEERITAEGLHYFVDHNTRQTSWVDHRTRYSVIHTDMPSHAAGASLYDTLELPSKPNLRPTGMPTPQL